MESAVKQRAAQRIGRFAQSFVAEHGHLAAQAFDFGGTQSESPQTRSDPSRDAGESLDQCAIN